MIGLFGNCHLPEVQHPRGGAVLVSTRLSKVCNAKLVTLDLHGEARLGCIAVGKREKVNGW